MESVSNVSDVTPFDNIAVCLSGGGFRAAAYSLGVLSYLNRIKITGEDKNAASLLEHVSFIASTSGGTITNLLYSSYLHRHKNESEAFYSCLKKLYREMNGERLLTDALENLANDALWEKDKTGKQRNIINAFAMAYDDTLFGGETFDIFLKEKTTKDFSVCCNATEFQRGLSFRFQNEGGKSIFDLNGNKYIHFDEKQHEVVGKIKLADILAASSCFPAGFEPIIFPEDFSYTDVIKGVRLSSDDLRNSLLYEEYDGSAGPLKKSIALMDGGVTDNQAVNSIMLADKRRKKQNKKTFDLIMISDVTSYFMAPYKVPPQTNADWGIKNLSGTLKYLTKAGVVLNWIFVVSLLLFLLSLTGIQFLDSQSTINLCYFLLGISVLLCSVLGVIQWVRHRFPLVKTILSASNTEVIKTFIKNKASNGLSTDVIDKLVSYIITAKLSSLYDMLMSRMKSIVTMSVEVNLKQVRRLIYSLFYENKTWENIRVSNFIYELGTKNLNSRTSHLAQRDEKKKPSDYLTGEDRKLLLATSTAIQNIADEALSMGTTLWFVKNDNTQKKLDKIIEAGQFTTCAKLLEYTLTLIRQSEYGVLPLSLAVLNKLNELKQVLVTDWEHFNEQPHFLFDEEMRKLNRVINEQAHL